MRDESQAGNISNVSISRERDRRVSDRRLDSWKEIGAYFGRDERTVKRWEVSRGLPVHRVPGSGRATIYAYASELERWLATERGPVVGGSRANPVPPVESQSIQGGPEISIDEEEDVPSSPVEDAPPEAFLAESSPHDSSVSGNTQTGEPGLPAVAVLSKAAGLWNDRLWRYLALSSLLAVSLAGGILAIAYRLHTPTPTTAVPPRPRALNPEAQDFYLKGEYYLQKRTPESLNQAVDNFTQAIVRDPGYAQAYAGLADCYNLLREYTAMPASEAYPRALAAAKQAIALDDSLSRAHSALAFVDFYWLWNTAGAEREFKRAIALDPNSARAHHWYATYLYHLGRFQQALSEIDRAQMLDPSSRAVVADKGLLLYHAGHPDQGIALLKQLEAAEPGFFSPHNYLAEMYREAGNDRGFLAESFAAARLRGDSDRLSILEAGQKGFGEGGNRGMLEALFARQTVLYTGGRVPAYALAQTSAELGRSREALEYLRIAYSRREPEVPAMRVDAALRSLHNAPEYRKVLADVGLPPIP